MSTQQFDARRLFIGDDNSELRLSCPACGSECTHVQKVWALEGADEFEGRGQFGELYGVPVGGLTRERRGCLVIQIWGECGHTFCIDLQQHKGSTFVQTRLMEAD